MQWNVRTVVLALLAVAGAVCTWYFNIQFSIEEGGTFSLAEFVRLGFSNPAAASLSSDVTVAALTCLLWLPFEARRLSMRRWWIYAVLTVTVAFAFAFPLFLLMRERRFQHLLRESGTTG